MNQQNLIGSIKILALLVCTSGAFYLGLSLFGRSRQIQEFKQANQLLKERQYNSAIAIYDRLLAENIAAKDSISIYRGYAFKGLNQYEDMLQSCTQATSFAAQSGLAWNCQGEALYYLQQYQDALKAFERAASIEPSESTFWLNKARVLSDLERYDLAIEASDRAIELSDRSNKENKTIAWNLKGQNLLKIAEYRKSIVAFEKSLSYSADSISPRQGKGIALYELGKYDLAIAIFQEILQSDRLTKSQQATVLLYLGVSLCQIEEIAAAEKMLQKVLSLTIDPASIAIATKKCGIRQLLDDKSF